MEQRHYPPVGGWMRDHTTSVECWCSPEVQKVYKRNSTGRGGSSQGRTLVRVNIKHKIPE